jgi:LysR family glycine cleavage system transcriptional activator
MTRAAAELGVTPAAVSLRIRNLEAELGTPLFVRAGPRINATHAANLLAARLTEALNDIERAVQACRGGRMRIKITAVPTLAARWLAGALAEFQRINSDADVVVDSTDLVRPLASFDLSLRHGRGKWGGLTAEEIFSGEATAMVAPEVAAKIQRPRDLTRLPLIPDDRWTSWFRRLGVVVDDLNFTVDYPSQELAAAAVMAGAGSALLSPVLFATFLREGKLIRPFAALTSGSNPYFVVVAENERRAAVLDLRDFLLDHARAMRDSLEELAHAE